MGKCQNFLLLMQIVCFVCSFIYHLDGFPLLAVVNNAARNMVVHIFECLLSVIWGVYQEVPLLNTIFCV